MLKTIRYFLISVVALLGLIILAVVVIAQLDTNRFKPFIETQVSELTGRTLRIEGDLLIEYSLPPLIRIEKASFANADWGMQPLMLSVELLQLKARLIPLLDRQLIIDQLLLRGVDLSIERDAQKRLNWQLEKLASDTEQADTGSADTSLVEPEPFQMPVLPVLKNIELDDIRVHYLDKAEDIETVVTIASLRLNHASIEDDIRLSINGQINQQAFSVTGKTAFLSEVTTENLADQGISLQLDADAIGVAVEASGTIRNPLDATGIELDTSIDAEDLDHTFTIITGTSIYRYIRASEKPLPLRLSARLSDDAGRYDIDRLSLQLGDSDVSGKLSYKDEDERPRISLDLASRRINLNQFLAEKTADSKKGQASVQTGSDQDQRPAAIQLPKQRLPFDLLDTLDAEVSISIGELVYEEHTPRSIKLDASLEDRRLEVKTLDLNYDDTPIRSSLRIDSAARPVLLQATLGIEKLPLASLSERLELQQLRSGTLTSIIDLRSRGDNVDAIIRSLDGEANLRLTDTALELSNDDRQHAFDISQFELVFNGMQKTMRYEFYGTIDEQPISVDGRLSSPSAVIDNTALDTELELQAVNASLDLRGRIDRPSHADTAKLDLALDIPDPRRSVKELSRLIPGIKPDDAIPDLATTVRADIDLSPGVYDINGLSLNLGENDLSGDIHIDTNGEKPSITARLESESINLNELVPATRIEEDNADTEITTSGSDQQEADDNGPGRIFPDKPLPALDALDTFELDLDYQLSSLSSNQQTVDNIHLKLRLKDSLLIIDPISVDFADGTVRSRLELNTVGTPQFRLDKKIIAMDYDRLMNILGVKEYARGEMDAEIRLTGTGVSIRQMMASLDGSIRLTTVDGELDSESIKLLSKDIMSVIPFTDSSDRQKIHCGVLQLNIEEGIASTHSMVINTGAISALGTGDINLTDETISMYVAPRTKRTSVIKLALVPVNITGPLIDPSITPDIAGSTISTTKTATNVGLTIATGGVWLLAEGLTNELWDQFVDNTDYCAKALAGDEIIPTRIDLKTQKAKAEQEKAEQQAIDELLDDDENEW